MKRTKKRAHRQKKQGRRGRQTDKNVQNINKRGKLAIWWKKTTKQSINSLEKIGQVGEWRYNIKKQKSKQEIIQTIAQNKYHNMPENAGRENAKKTALLICWLQHQKRQFYHRSKAQRTKNILAKIRSKQQRKNCAKYHTMRACNTEPDLVNGIWHPKTKNEFSVAIFLK